jgi:hypothetical protein
MSDRDLKHLPPIARARAMHKPLRSSWRPRLIGLVLVLTAAILARHFLARSEPRETVNTEAVTYITVQPAEPPTVPASP